MNLLTGASLLALDKSIYHLYWVQCLICIDLFYVVILVGHVTVERRHDLITVLKPHFLPKRLRSSKSEPPINKFIIFKL